MEVSGDKRCVNAECPAEIDCACEEELLGCFDQCTSDDQCEGDWRCMTYPGTDDKRCLNAECVEESDCSCAVTQASPSPQASPPSQLAQASPAPPRAGQPELPEAGVPTPAVLGVSAGLLLMLLGLLF